MQIKINAISNEFIPVYQTENSAGADIKAYITDPIIIAPNECKLIPTGLFVEFSPEYHIEIRPRSGLALKNQITVLNSPGTIDADYRGEIGVILMNFGKQEFVVKRGDRIAQMVIVKSYQAEFEIGQIQDSERGQGGFGSTGV